MLRDQGSGPNAVGPRQRTPGPLSDQRVVGCARSEVIVMRHKRSIPNRGLRVADQIQRDLADLVRELKDPRLGMVTISAVEVTPDYAHARVYFTVLVGEPQVCQDALNEAAGFLRSGLFKRLALHTIPTLHFQFDRTTERAARLQSLIHQANASRAKD